VPQEVPITRRVLREITKELLPQGWRLMGTTQMDEQIIKYRLESQRDQPRGVGFEKSDGNGHTVRLRLPVDYYKAVHLKRTMPLFEELSVNFPEGNGMAWALIVDANDKAMYYATPRIKTLNFKENFLFNVEVTWQRVANWPKCEKCGLEMEIVETPKHQNWWGCYRVADHADGEPFTKNWNFALTPEQLKKKNAEYRQRAKGRAKARKDAKVKGKPDPQKAHDIRIASKIKNGRAYPPAA
jgi:hypothetical protein